MSAQVANMQLVKCLSTPNGLTALNSAAARAIEKAETFPSDRKVVLALLARDWFETSLGESARESALQYICRYGPDLSDFVYAILREWFPGALFDKKITENADYIRVTRRLSCELREKNILFTIPEPRPRSMDETPPIRPADSQLIEKTCKFLKEVNLAAGQMNITDLGDYAPILRTRQRKYL